MDNTRLAASLAAIRLRRRACALGAAALLMTGCGDDASDPFGPDPCNRIASTAITPPPGLTASALRPALLDASTRLTRTLPQGNAAAELQGALTALERQIGESRNDACRALLLATGALARLPSTADMQPDRQVIGFVLELSASLLPVAGTGGTD